MKLYFYVLLFIFLSGCFHETSLISNYGQRIVKIPNQTETTDALNATKNVNKPNVNLSNKDINYTNKVRITNIRFIPQMVASKRLKRKGGKKENEYTG